MAGGGATRARAQASTGGGRRRRHQAASLPIDVIAAIAARSDPATLVRCAATCGDMRGRVADPGIRLRLRHGDRFVPSLLRGHLIGEPDHTIMRLPEDSDPRDLYLVDATARFVVPAADTFPPGPDGEPLELYRPLSAREGLVLVNDGELRVCNLATGRSQSLPPGPNGPELIGGRYVLLVGDGDGGGAVGRPFQVVRASLVLEEKRRRLLAQTFSSELNTWGPCTEIRTPQIHGRSVGAYTPPLRPGPVVASGAVHWLCLTDAAGYVLKLRVRAAAPPQLTVMKLPERFPNNGGWQIKHLLATMEAGGGSLAVLVADKGNISAWTQSKHSARWNQQPQVVIECEAAISRLLGNVAGEERRYTTQQVPNLVWFAERSGIVLIKVRDCFVWLDLQSKQIVSCSEDPNIRYKHTYCPLEMDLSTWVPSFTASF